MGGQSMKRYRVLVALAALACAALAESSRAQAPGVPATAAPHAAESIFGVWSTGAQCGPTDDIVVLTRRYVGDDLGTRFAATYEAGQDGVLVIAATRAGYANDRWTEGGAPATPGGTVYRREGNTLRAVRQVDAQGNVVRELNQVLVSCTLPPAEPVRAAGTEWLAGRWSVRCDSPPFMEFGANEVTELVHGGLLGFRLEATYAATADVVVITFGRSREPGVDPDAPGSGTTMVVRRSGDRMQVIGIRNPTGPADTRPQPDMQRCPAPATTAAASAAAGEGAESIFGVWATREACRPIDHVQVFTRQFVSEEAAARHVVTYRPRPDGVVVNHRNGVGRHDGRWIMGGGGFDLARFVYRRDGNTLRVVALLNPEGRVIEQRTDVMYACDR